MSLAATTWAFSQHPESPVEKFVLVVLADAHNGHTGQCNPSAAHIAKVTGYHRATVVRALDALEAGGFFTVVRASGKSCQYVLAMDATHSRALPVAERYPSHSATPPVAESDTTHSRERHHLSHSATRTRKEPGNNQEENRERDRAARSTRIPDDFDLTPERRAVAETERVPPERTFAAFTDYWRSAPGAKGRKADWEATWRNWCRRQADMTGRGGQSNGRRRTRAEESWAEYQDFLRDEGGAGSDSAVLAELPVRSDGPGGGVGECADGSFEATSRTRDSDAFDPDGRLPAVAGAFSGIVRRVPGTRARAPSTDTR